MNNPWPLAELTIPGILRSAAADRGESVALSFSDGGQHPAAELWEAALRVALGLRNAGLEPGDRVGIFLSNRVEILHAWFGAFAAGCVPVPLNTAQRGAVLQHMMTLCGMRAIVVESALLPPITDALAATPTLKVVAIVDVPKDLEALHGRHTLDFADWLLQTNTLTPFDSSPRDLATLMLTSGTTGPSKAVMWTHTTAIMMAHQAAGYMNHNSDDVIYTCLPLFHGNALFCSLIPGLLSGSRIVIAPRFSASSFWKEQVDAGATKTSMLGSMQAILYRQPPTPFDTKHSVELAHVAPAPIGFYDEFEERFKIRVTQYYGLTDMNTVIGVRPQHLDIARTKPASCGTASDYWDLKIVDDSDNDVATGAVGELLIRPRVPFSGQLGYFNMPDETVKAWRNMWFHTGDNVRQDTDGWYYFVDRKKDAMRRAGENVSSFEVESVLRLFRGIVEAAVYAVPAVEGEDEIMATIEVDASWDGDHEALLRYCMDQLAYFAIPRFVRIVTEFPRTGSQKIRKDVLRNEGVTSDTWDRGPGGRRSLAARFDEPKISRYSI